MPDTELWYVTEFAVQSGLISFLQLKGLKILAANSLLTGRLTTEETIHPALQLSESCPKCDRDVLGGSSRVTKPRFTEMQQEVARTFQDTAQL